MITRRAAVASLSAGLSASLLPGQALAAKPAVYNSSGVAINGYDPTAYFLHSRPIKGKSAHAVIWRDVQWRFESAASQALFEAEPTAYAPQYGGYCAWAVSRGYTASTDPDAWRVYEGKLYLNYNRAVQARWSINIPGNIARADANWPGVLAA